MRKITVYDQVALIALAGESMVCYIGLHNVVQLDVIASLLGLVFNSSVLLFLYCHSFRRVLTGSIKPNETVMPKETVNHPFPNDDNHIIIYKEREERELKTIDAVFNYTMHYIGQYLSLDERTLIRENSPLIRMKNSSPLCRTSLMISIFMTSPTCAMPSVIILSPEKTSIR